MFANKEYPLWTFEVISKEFVGSIFFLVHGRLRWYEEGVTRSGDYIAAHRIQYKSLTSEEAARGVERYTFDRVVDLGNDL